MNVPNVPNAITGLASRFRHGAISDIKAAAGKAAAAVQSATPSATAAMREVLSHYDMTDITPNDFSKLLQQLSEKGTISQQDKQELSSIRVDLENAGINSDDSVNLLNFYQQQIAKAQSAAPSSNPGAANPATNALIARLNWLQKFAAAGQQGGPSGVNTVA